MSYRMILALISGDPSDAEVLATAADLARRFDGQVRVLPCTPDPAASMIGFALLAGDYVSPVAEAELCEAQVRAVAAIQVRARKAADRAGIAFKSAGASGPGLQVVEPGPLPWRTMVNEAPFADLVVMAHETAQGGGTLSPAFADVLVDLRLPVLLTDGPQPAKGGVVAVAWDGGMEVGRAVRAALPLLHQAERVLVLQAEQGIAWTQRDAASLDRCMRYLELHGVTRLESQVIEDSAAGGALADAVKRAGAGLLVAGAYGHPRWQEVVIGGVTRTLLRAVGGPHLLLCH
jgi:nucleotide-binding universal stress UspA family protein